MLSILYRIVLFNLYRSKKSYAILNIQFDISTFEFQGSRPQNFKLEKLSISVSINFLSQIEIDNDPGMFRNFPFQSQYCEYFAVKFLVLFRNFTLGQPAVRSQRTKTNTPRLGPGQVKLGRIGDDGVFN